MKIKLHKKYSNKINESIMELKKVKPLFESTIDPGSINLDAYTLAFQDKGATDSILAEFKISKSLFEYLTLKKVPSNYDALMTVTNMPKKFFNINLSYDNKPEETIKKADDYAFKYFDGINFKISNLTSVKPSNESIDYTDLDSLIALNEGPSDHGSFLFGGDFIGDHRMNNKDLQNQHTEDKQKAVDASISNGSKRMKSITTAIDNYIDNVVSSLKVCIEEFSPNGAAALKEFDKAVNTLKSGAVNGEKMMEYIKHLDQNHKDLENAKLEKIEAERDSLQLILGLLGEVMNKMKKDDAFRSKCTADVLAKLSKAKKKVEFDNILDKAGLTLESLSYEGNNVLNEIALNEAEETKTEELDIDEMYDGSYTILKNALDPIFETARDELKSVKKARELMETLLKKRSEEISNRIGAICRIGGNSKEIPGLSQLARTFLSSHPLRAEGLKNIWANHEIDLQNRMENRLNSLKSGEIMSYAEDFITNQIPRIIAMMLAYKTIARVLEVKSAHMSSVGVKKVREIVGDALNATDELTNTILMTLCVNGSNITSPDGTDLYTFDASAADINTRYVHNAAAQFDLNGKLGLFVQNIGFKDSQTFTDYVNALNANIGTPVNVAKIILNYAELCKTEKVFVNNPNKLVDFLEIQQDSLDKVTNYKALLESAKIGDITDNKQIEGMKKLLAVAYKAKDISSINASTLEGEIDRDKLAIVNGFDLAKLFTIDSSKEIISQIYEDAREMQLTDNFDDAKDLMSFISTMTSLVNLITNKELLEAAINKQDDSLLAAFFEYIRASRFSDIAQGIVTMSEVSENIPDTSIGVVRDYLNNPDKIISDYRGIEESKHKITIDNVPADLNAKLLKGDFDKVYDMNFADSGLIKIANEYNTVLPEITNKEKHESLMNNLKTLMKMLIDILIVKANNEQEARDQYEKILKETEAEVNEVDKYFMLLESEQETITNNAQTIVTILLKIYSSGKDFTKETVKTQEIDKNTAFVKKFDIEKLFKLPAEIEVDGTNIAINDFKIGTNATNAYAFVKACIVDNGLLTTMKLQDLGVDTTKPSEVVKCLTRMINVFTNEELLKENKDTSAEDAASLEDTKKYVNDAYKSNEWTFGSKDGEKSSIQDFIKRYVEAGKELEKLKENYKEGDAKKALDAAISLKKEADKEIEDKLVKLTDSEEVNKVIKEKLKPNDIKLNGLLINLFEKDLSEKETNSSKEVIEVLKDMKISEKDAFIFLYGFFKWLNGDIRHATNIVKFVENCMYEPEEEELGEATLENSIESSENTEKELTSESLYYGNQKYIFENDILNALNEDEKSKSIGDILRKVFDYINDKGSKIGKKLFSRLTGNDTEDNGSKDDSKDVDNKGNQSTAIDPKVAKEQAELISNVLAKTSSIDLSMEILKTLQLSIKSNELSAKAMQLQAKTISKLLNGQNPTNTANNQNDELTPPGEGGQVESGVIKTEEQPTGENEEK